MTNKKIYFYTSYQDFKDNHEQDYNQYKETYQDATINDFMDEVKSNYEMFNFDDEVMTIGASIRTQDVLYQDVCDFFNNMVSVQRFTRHDHITKSTRVTYDKVKELLTEESLKGEGGFVTDYQFDILESCYNDIEGLSLTKLQNLKFAYKKIFEHYDTLINDQSDTLRKETNETAKNDKEPKRNFHFDSEKRYITPKSKLNQPQTILFGRLIHKFMIGKGSITDFDLARGLDLIFNQSSVKTKDFLNSGKEYKIKDDDVSLLYNLLQNMIDELNKEYPQKKE